MNYQNIENEIKKYSDFFKLSQNSIFKLSTYYKEVSKQGIKFINKIKQSLDAFYLDVLKEDRTTTYNKLLINIYNEKKEIIEKVKIFFTNIDKNYGDKLAEYEKDYKKKGKDLIYRLTKMSEDLTKNKIQLDKWKNQYFEFCKNSNDLEKKIKTMENQNEKKDALNKLNTQLNNNEGLKEIKKKNYEKEKNNLNKQLIFYENDYYNIINTIENEDVEKMQFVINVIKDSNQNNIILMKDFDCFSYNYFLENMNLIRENTLKSNEILTEENNFKSIISIGINNISNLNNSIQEKLEKQCLDYNIFLDQNDKNIINNLLDYLNIITCFDVNMKIKIDLQHLLINCKKNDIEALIFKIKNDTIIKYNADNNHWIFKEGQEYEKQILKLFFSKIAPLFCEDIITSLISFHKNSKDAKYKMIDDLIIEAYKKSYYYNFENYFKEINTKRSIIYTFSKEARNLFKEIKIIENKFGKFDEDSTYYISIESITRENDLSIELKKFLFTEKKQLLIITFSENDLKFINSVNALIDNLEKENPKLNEKCVIFIINKQRKKQENIFNDEKYDSLSFINEKYNQIFIDDLFGKDYSNIFDIIIKLDNDWQKDYLLTTKFIENNITNVLNYIKFNLPIQNKEINSNNIKEQIANIILKKDILKNLFTDNLIKQGKGIKDLFKNAFKYYNKEEKNEEFFQIIDNEIKKNFIIFLLKIILHLLKKDILIPLYYNLDIIMENKYLYDMIKSEFNQNNYCLLILFLILI